MSDSIAKYLSDSWVDFNKALWDLIAFDIIFKVIAAIIFIPFTSWVFHRLISLSGNFVISNEKIVSFLLSPQGMAAVFFAALSAWAIYLAEQSGLMILTLQVALGGRRPYIHALYRTLRSLPRLFEHGMSPMKKQKDWTWAHGFHRNSKKSAFQPWRR